MAGAGMDAWVDTFVQLMANKKPQDVWVLKPQESLDNGHPDSGYLQYRLKGLSRLQCSHCPWTWSSAHVHILFHLLWDGDHSQGLVRMCVWSQQCQLCPPGARRDCQVSPRNIRVFIGQLALHILQKYYGEGPGPGQCPETCPRGCCEACNLGVCFLQKKGPSPWGPVIGGISTPKGRQTTHGIPAPPPPAWLAPTGHGSLPPVAPGSSALAATTPAKPITIPLLVIDFIEEPFLGSSDFPSKGDCVIIIPFSLRDSPDGHGCVTSGVGSLPAVGGSGSPVIGQGSICLSGSSVAMSECKGIPVDIRAPFFHGQALPHSTSKTFELRGFQFGGRGSTLSPVGVAKGQGPISFSNGCLAPGNDLPPVSYTVGLRASGEGTITFPSSLTNIIRGKDPFPSIAGGTRRDDRCWSLTTQGDRPPTTTHASGPTASEECSITLPFTFTNDAEDKDPFTDISEGQEKEDGQDPVPTSHNTPGATGSDGPISITEGTITIPLLAFSIIERKGPRYLASGPPTNGFATCSYYRKRGPRSRFGRSSRGSRQEEGFHSRRASRRPQAETHEDFWICISMAICIFWLMCMYRLDLGVSQQQA